MLSVDPRTTPISYRAMDGSAAPSIAHNPYLRSPCGGEGV